MRSRVLTMAAVVLVMVVGPFGDDLPIANAGVESQSVGAAVDFSSPRPGDAGLAPVDIGALREAGTVTKRARAGGAWVLPAHGPLTSTFGYRWGRLHAGIDLDGQTGDVVIAAAKGVVVAAGWSGGYGLQIEIDHGDGLRSSYSHLSSIDTVVGQAVSPGEPIGRMGNTGRSRGSHLHFEIRRHDVPIDPSRFVFGS